MTPVTELDEATCEELLRANEVGRVAFVTADQPIILPVNYTVVDGQIVFRTDPGLKLDEIPMRRVAFEIDGASHHAVWSVMAQGFAREVTTALGHEYDTLRAMPLAVVAPGRKEHWIAIEISALTGRRIQSSSLA